MTKEYDLVVLGGGIGGYVAAIRATQLGMSVALVEKNKLGGTCLHEGCIPSKALLKTAEIYRQLQDANEFGLEIRDMKINFNKTQERKKQVVNTLYQGVTNLLNQAKIDIYEGTGRILGSSIFSPMPGTISVEHDDERENTILTNKFVLIATGSTPSNLPNLTVDGEFIMHAHHALELETLPESIVIVGAGAIGIEWASLLQDLGVDVSVIESNATILSETDRDVSKEVQKQLEARGVQFFTNTQLDIDSVAVKNKQVYLQANRKDQVVDLLADKMLLAVGREANIAELGLQNTTIETENGLIQTNEACQTKENHIYAIGDCIGGMQLAHVASAEGVIAVEHMANLNPDPLNTLHVPICVYSHPEVASVGLTEEKAVKLGYKVKIGSFPFQGIGKAHINGDTSGFSKIIIDEITEDVLGVHVVGSYATELISEASLAKALDATAWEVSKTIHPHPSLSEVLFESALAVNGLEIHG